MIALAEQPVPDHTSVTALTTFLRCGRLYENRYVLKTPPAFRPGNLAFGTAVHSALGLFYGRRMAGMDEPLAEELAADFSDAWTRELRAGDVPVLLDDGDTEDGLRDRGVAMLGVFHEKAERPVTVLGVEQSFTVEVHDPENGEVLPPLVGRLDAIVEDRGGNFVVLEHKTAAKRYSHMKLRWDLQATAYSWAVQSMGLEARVAFQVLLKTKTPAIELYPVERSELDHRFLLHTIAGVHRAVMAGAFPPVRDWWCKGCPYAVPCLSR
jgi:putative RecB family exonuclease